MKKLGEGKRRKLLAAKLVEPGILKDNFVDIEISL